MLAMTMILMTALAFLTATLLTAIRTATGQRRLAPCAQRC